MLLRYGGLPSSEREQAHYWRHCQGFSFHFEAKSQESTVENVTK